MAAVIRHEGGVGAVSLDGSRIENERFAVGQIQRARAPAKGPKMWSEPLFSAPAGWQLSKIGERAGVRGVETGGVLGRHSGPTCHASVCERPQLDAAWKLYLSLWASRPLGWRRAEYGEGVAVWWAYRGKGTYVSTSLGCLGCLAKECSEIRMRRVLGMEPRPRRQQRMVCFGLEGVGRLLLDSDSCGLFFLL